MVQILTILWPFKVTEFLFTQTFYSAEIVCIIYQAEDVFLLLRRFYWFINEPIIAFTDDLSDLSLFSPYIIKEKGDRSLDSA